MNDQPSEKDDGVTDGGATGTGAREGGAYQVLARKYRPAHFRDLIGQEVMVRTLTNAFEHDRIAHAFILTGVRGVGKTTTARIIAKGLNCTGHGDGPTIDPCGECEACVSISEGRNVDVIEMDAASNTGVNDVREIIDAVRYRASQARYKVYIVDEVHMLSNSAFNALLKTLEEPPEHVKFIFATTEIRKVPVTVLSRCQRFDLRRIEPEAMMAHLASIAEHEGARLGPDALALITRAAEGSVRDALSLLDQAIAQGRDAEIGVAEVRAMLGLADRGRVFDLFEKIMAGDCPGALEELSRQYSDGADPAVVLRDLAELVHWVSVLRISETAAEDPTISPDEKARGQDLARRLSMRVLTRAWQMLLKAIEEVAVAPSSMMAAEMAVIRLTHVADLPPPEELIRKLRDDPVSTAAGRAEQKGGSGKGGSGGSARLASVSGGVAAQPAPAPKPDTAPRAESAAVAYQSLEDVVVAIEQTRDIKLLDEVESFVRPVALRPGLIEFNPAPGAPGDLAGRLSQALLSITGARWSVAVSDAPGGATIAEQRAVEKQTQAATAAQHPMILAAMEIFPGARIAAVRPLSARTAEPDDYLEAVTEDDDQVEIEGDILDHDDPFEEES